jgi:hypothetical protein
MGFYSAISDRLIVNMNAAYFTGSKNYPWTLPISPKTHDIQVLQACRQARFMLVTRILTMKHIVNQIHVS